MREARYRFPEEVRSTTRAMASRMVNEATIAETPAELEAWLADNPKERQSLEGGGYNTKFSAADLLPLLQVLIERAGGPPPRPTEEPPSPPPKSIWPVISAALLLIIVIAVAALVLL